MKKTFFILIVLLSLSLSACSSTSSDKEESKPIENETSQNSNEGIRLGNKLPEIKLETLDGRDFNYSDYEGKKTAIFFFASWCPYCHLQLEHLQKLEAERDDFDYILIDLLTLEDDISDVEKYIEDNNIDKPVLLDTDGVYMKAFRIRGTPHNVFLDEEGLITYILPGAQEYEFVEGILNQGS